MTSPILTALWENWQFKLSLITLAGIFLIPLVTRHLFNLIPAFAAADKLKANFTADSKVVLILCGGNRGIADLCRHFQ